MKLEPLDNRVLLKPDSKEGRTKGGIILPEAAESQKQFADVVATGPNVEEVAPGDRVIFSVYGGSTVKVGEEDLLVIREEDIFIKIIND